MSDPLARMDAEHPSAEALAAYLSRRLSAPETLDFEVHLSNCWQCRQEVIGGRRLLRSRGVDRRWLVVPVTAAAVLALFLLRPGPVEQPRDDRLRGRGSQGLASLATLTVVSPADGDTTSVDGLSFTWRAAPGDPLYRVTIADRTGRTLWTGDTSDTTITPGGAIRLDRASSFFWNVDALDVQGRSVTTGTRSFHTSP